MRVVGQFALCPSTGGCVLNSTRLKMTAMRKIVLPIGVLLLVGLLYIGRPFLYCWYNQHRFDRYVHVRVDLSSCGETALGQGSRPCRYIFSFEGVEGPDVFQFVGTDLYHSYDSAQRTYIVSGVGRLAYQSKVIELSSTKVLFNGVLLPVGTQPVLVFVKNDGELLSGYCDVSW
jgi:hypothetical protein